MKLLEPSGMTFIGTLSPYTSNPCSNRSWLEAHPWMILEQLCYLPELQKLWHLSTLRASAVRSENATKIFVWFLTGCRTQLPAPLSVAMWLWTLGCSAMEVYFEHPIIRCKKNPKENLYLIKFAVKSLHHIQHSEACRRCNSDLLAF